MQSKMFYTNDTITSGFPPAPFGTIPSTYFKGVYQVKLQNVGTIPCRVGTSTHPLFTVFAGHTQSFNYSGELILYAEAVPNSSVYAPASTTILQMAAFGEAP